MFSITPLFDLLFLFIFRGREEDERKSGKGGRREGEEDVGGGGLGFGKWVEVGGFMIQD